MIEETENHRRRFHTHHSDHRRVPIKNSHAVNMNIEFNKPFELEEVVEYWKMLKCCGDGRSKK